MHPFTLISQFSISTWERAPAPRYFLEKDDHRQSLAHLPPREATVFCLRYFDDLPYEKIAESLQITTGAAAVALHKARTRLEALLLQPVAGESHDGTIA